MTRSALSQLNVIVSDMVATLAFYRRLGWSVETRGGSDHAVAEQPNGFRVEFDSTAFAGAWDGAHDGRTGGSTVLGAAVASRDGVDELYAELVAHGARARQPPYDAFWGARYAIVEDPDGNPVGLMSPVEESMKSWPPPPSPPRPG